MNAYLVDCFTDLESPVPQFYLFADSFQEALKKVVQRKDLVVLKEIQIFQDPKTVQIPTLSSFQFKISPMNTLREHRTIGVLAENVDIAFSLILEHLTPHFKLVEFLLGEQRLAPFIST